MRQSFLMGNFPGRLFAAFLLCLSCAAAQDDLSRAVQLHQSGDYAGAIAAYEQFLKAHPEAAPVRSNLGAALAHEGRLAEAIREYKLALDADPSNAGVRFNLALAYYKTGDLDSAAREFETVRATLPSADDQSRRVALLLGDCYLRRGNDKKVIEILEPLASTHTDDLTLAYLLGTAYIHVDQEERGQALIDRIVRIGDTAEAHMFLAFRKMKGNDRKGAMAETARAIELNPKLPDAFNLQGRIQFQLSDLSGAEKSFRKALALDPSAFEPLLFLGSLLREQGRLDEAREYLGRALAVRPSELRARYQFAVLEAAQGQDERAATQLEAVIKDLPQFAEAHRSLSAIYFRLGRTADGKRERATAEKLDEQIDAGNQAIGKTLK